MTTPKYKYLSRTSSQRSSEDGMDNNQYNMREITTTAVSTTKIYQKTIREVEKVR